MDGAIGEVVGHLSGGGRGVVGLGAISDSPLSAVLTAIEQIVTRLDRIEVGQVQLQTGQVHLRADLMERMDPLQDGSNQRREGHVVDWGNVDQVERMARSALDETRALGEQMTALTRFMHRLEASIEQLRGDG